MLPPDVCWCIIHMHHDCDLEPKEIARLLWTPKHSICENSVKNVLLRFEEFGTVDGSAFRYQPHRGHMKHEHAVVLIEIISLDPWLYLDEIVQLRASNV